MPRGKLGAGMSIEEGYPHARQAGLVLIAGIKDALGGDLDGVEGSSRCWVRSTPQPISRDYPKVVNGCWISLSRSLGMQAGTRVRRSA
jgi:hypothetical protein